MTYYYIIPTIILYLPSNVRGCNVTEPVCTYSTNCRNTSASNSSTTITVGDVMFAKVLYDDVLVPENDILLLFLILVLFGGDFCCCCYEI